MKIWQKETLTWNCSQGIGTSIAENGDFNTKVSNGFSGQRRHDLHEMSVFSKYVEDGNMKCGVMTLHIKQSYNVDTAIEVIVNRLKSAFVKLTDGPNAIRQCGIHINPPKEKSWSDGKFTLIFVLAEREEFCDQAIEIGRAIHEALGIEDSTGYRLADFSLSYDKFVMLDGVWITFVRWLRMGHRLPIFDTKDMLSTIK